MASCPTNFHRFSREFSELVKDSFDSVIYSSLFLNPIDLPLPNHHDALAERETFGEFRFLANQVEVFIAGEFQRDDGQLVVCFEFAVGPDSFAQVEGLARNLAHLTSRRLNRREFFGLAQLLLIFAEALTASRPADGKTVIVSVTEEVVAGLGAPWAEYYPGHSLQSAQTRQRLRPPGSRTRYDV